ncbi:MAG TPA: helix-turn-helix domain-containing protein, partial [Reyranella sp.]
AGLSVVHVNRTIQTLRSLRVLSKGSYIEVIDRERLEQLAKFDGLYLTPAEARHSPVVSAAVARANPRSLSARAPAA